MHTQTNLILTELKDSLKKRKYKAVVSKIERILERLDNQYYSLECLISFLLLESSAINKLLERNLLKKYKYEPKLVQDLIMLLGRNLDEIHLLLIQILDINIETMSFQERETSTASFSLIIKPEERRNIKIQKLNINSQKKKSSSQVHKYIRKFIAMISTSIINTIQMMLIYRKQIVWSKIQSWTLTISSFHFSSPNELIIQSKMLLLFGKLLSLDGHQQIVRSQNIIDQAIQKLIDSIRLTNKAFYKKNITQKKIKKYEQIHRQCYKLIIIAVVISNKNNMKLQKQEVATFGCNIIKTYVQNLSNTRFNLFKRLMQPQIYIQQQFLRYRQEKQQLCEIVSLYFSELKLKVVAVNEDRLFSRNKWNFLNLQKNDRQFRTSGKEKPLLQDISTSKSILTVTKVKGNNSITSFRNNSKQSMNVSKEMRDNILANMIVTHIEDMNHKYKKLQKNISKETYKSSQPKIKNLIQGKILKRQKISQSTRMQQQSNQDIKAKFSRLRLAQESQKEKIKAEKKKLKRRMYYNMFEDILPQFTPAACEVSNDLYNNRPIFNLRTSDEREQQQQQTEFKHKISNLSSKSKLFLEILFMNKNGLGIRKIVQKFQMMKKKQQQKQKLLSNRLTSSFHREREHIHSNSLFKLHIITQAILKKHINGYQDDTPGESPTIEARMLHRERKAIEASYTLGQDSIEAVKGKLLGKISSKQKVVDRSQRKQQVFKQKLKRLGSNNFFLKRVCDKNDDRDTQINSSKSMDKNIIMENF